MSKTYWTFLNFVACFFSRSHLKSWFDGSYVCADSTRKAYILFDDGGRTVFVTDSFSFFGFYLKLWISPTMCFLLSDEGYMSEAEAATAAMAYDLHHGRLWGWLCSMHPQRKHTRTYAHQNSNRHIRAKSRRLLRSVIYFYLKLHPLKEKREVTIILML